MKNKNNLVFITNDDGFNSEGIKVLHEICEPMFQEIQVFAPALNQSAKSHSITINNSLALKKIGVNKFNLLGTPADCVMIGLNKLSNESKIPKLLLSGINEGANLGLDLLYSGTVAAAREGSLNGIKSVAISIDAIKQSIEWAGLKYYAPRIIKGILKNNIPNNIFYNINFPNLQKSSIEGLKIVRLGKRKPGNVIIKNKTYYKIPSERKILSTAKKGEDEFELRRNFITISIHACENLILDNKLFLKTKKSLGKLF